MEPSSSGNIYSPWTWYGGQALQGVRIGGENLAIRSKSARDKHGRSKAVSLMSRGGREGGRDGRKGGKVTVSLGIRGGAADAEAIIYNND